MGTVLYSFPVTFAGVSLEVTDFASERGRDVIEHRPARGNGAQTFDRGRKPLRTDMTFVLTGTAEEITAKRAQMNALSNSGAVRTFQHPIDGPIACRLVDLSEHLRAGELSYRCSLIEDSAFARKLDDVTEENSATIQDVRSAADALDVAMIDLALEDAATVSAILGSAAGLEVAEAWESDPPPVDRQASQLGKLRTDYGASTEQLDAGTSVASYRALIAMLEFRAELERYAVALQKRAPRTVLLTVLADAPLIVILSAFPFYGPREAGRFASEVVRINAITNPLRIAAGVKLRLPVLDG